MRVSSASTSSTVTSFSDLTGTASLAQLPVGTGFFVSSGGTNSIRALVAGDIPDISATYATRSALSGTGYLKGAAGFVSFVTTIATTELTDGSFGSLNLSTSGTFGAGAATVTSLDAGSGTITTTGHVDPGATGTGRSTIGDIRFGQSTARTLLGMRNNGNSADVAIISVDASNHCYFGGTSTNTLAPGITHVTGVAGVILHQGSTSLVTFNTTQLQLNITPLQFAQGLASPRIEHATLAADAATTDLTIIAQAPWASASTNKNSANLLLKTAAPVSGGTAGAVKLMPNGSTVIEAGDAKIGFYGVTSVTRPSAYTQTYSTTTRTHANFTSSDLTGITSSTTGSALAEPSAAYTQSEMQQNFRRIQDQVVALRADVANLKQLVNQLIDDHQANGLLQ